MGKQVEATLSDQDVILRVEVILKNAKNLAEKSEGRVDSNKIVADLLQNLDKKVTKKIESITNPSLNQRLVAQGKRVDVISRNVEGKKLGQIMFLENEYQEAVEAEKEIIGLLKESNSNFDERAKIAVGQSRSFKLAKVFKKDKVLEAMCKFVDLNALMYSRGGSMTPQVSELFENDFAFKTSMLGVAARKLSGIIHTQKPSSFEKAITNNPEVKNHILNIVANMFNEYEDVKNSLNEHELYIEYHQGFDMIIALGYGDLELFNNQVSNMLNN